MASRTAGLLLLSLLALASAAAGRVLIAPSFLVSGRVFCDTCRAGFETPATTYLAGAKVKVECKDRETGELKYSAHGVTDLSGTYNVFVANEHADQICEASLVSSPDAGCATVVPGRDHAMVVLTHNNGIPSNVRFANSMGFQKDTALVGCAEVMKIYQQDDA